MTVVGISRGTHHTLPGTNIYIHTYMYEYSSRFSLSHFDNGRLLWVSDWKREVRKFLQQKLTLKISFKYWPKVIEYIHTFHWYTQVILDIHIYIYLLSTKIGVGKKKLFCFIHVAVVAAIVVGAFSLSRSWSLAAYTILPALS